jgi:hypothetical protein
MCTALVVIVLVIAVLAIPAVARIVGVVVLILLALGAAALAEERRVETPPQYRGAWCATKWPTIYRRCKEFDHGWTLTIKRQSVMSEDTVCEPSAVRRGDGEHRVWLTCHVDVKGDRSETQERWRLGTNRTRLQILRRFDEP